MLLSTAIAVVLSLAPHPHPQVRAQATVRIAKGGRGTKDEWTRSLQKREIVIVENGQPQRIRLVEFE